MLNGWTLIQTWLDKQMFMLKAAVDCYKSMQRSHLLCHSVMGLLSLMFPFLIRWWACSRLWQQANWRVETQSPSSPRWWRRPEFTCRGTQVSHVGFMYFKGPILQRKNHFSLPFCTLISQPSLKQPGKCKMIKHYAYCRTLLFVKMSFLKSGFGLGRSIVYNHLP